MWMVCKLIKRRNNLMYLTSTGSSEECASSAVRQRHYRWIWNSRTPCSWLANKIIKRNWICSFISLVTELHAIVQRDASLCMCCDLLSSSCWLPAWRLQSWSLEVVTSSGNKVTRSRVQSERSKISWFWGGRDTHITCGFITEEI